VKKIVECDFSATGTMMIFAMRLELDAVMGPAATER
jgi:hypothetical protein